MSMAARRAFHTCRGSRMGQRIESPTGAFEAAELIAGAVADGQRIEIIGGGSKRGYGGPAPGADLTLWTARLGGILHYDPQEMVLTAGAGEKLSAIDALLAEHNQMLGFEPPDFGAAFGGEAGETTLGGVLAANLSGPRRIASGAARDHFLGFEAVSGKGQIFKAGGKVFKNVTGFDLPKLMAGSWGTLALLTEVTVKVVPKPKTTTTVILRGASFQNATGAMTRAMGQPLAVSGAVMLPTLKGTQTAFRLEGFGPSVEVRAERLAAQLEPFGEVEVRDAAFSENFWRDIGRVAPLASEPGSLWRLSVPPATGLDVVRAVDGAAAWIADWAGGLVWVLAAPDATLDLPAIAAAVGGSALKVRGEVSEVSRQPAHAALSGLVRAAFDPHGVFASRAMVA